MFAKKLDMKKWINNLRLKANGQKYTCRRATYFIEKRHEKALNINDLTELYMHLIICPFCRLYRIQSAMIHKMLRKIIRTESANTVAMNGDVKVQLQQIIDEKNRNI
ncbi:hypothetical protein SAMN05428947_114115 [Mucilaginibacter sp. OK283]|jgi:hypothetical protein|nr:hypothetical protein SAMN05428947_114115 [Mucilaginibacter sp. OK283]